MRLASLTLHGFKSFGDRTTVELAPGVTALIGPNGSGKSNLIDALKWATGGGRASSYRAGDRRDLIFHGADGKRAVGRAEVEVEFEDGERSLKVARTLDREGVTRLRLNGRAARLLDVDDALAGSGLGRAGVSVIGQGEIGQVLMADPTKLLGYVAEAAGVARLTGRRDLSAARLDTARQHLERLGDVLLELELQLDRLEREAGAAARHASLSREALLLRFTAASNRREGLREEIRKLLARQIALSGRIEAGRGALQEREAAQLEARRALRLGEETYREAHALAERRRAEVRVAEVRLAGAEQRRSALTLQRKGVLLELDQLAGLTPPEAPDGDLERLQALEVEAERAHNDLQRDLSAAEARLAERRSAAEAAAALEAERLQRSAYARARRDELTAQRDQASAALASLEALAGPSIAEAEAVVARLAPDSERAERDALAARHELERAHAEHASAAAESQALARAVERQRAALDARRSYAQGPRAALTSGLPGIVGSVADLIGVPAEFEAAIATALGRRAESVVIELAEQADAILASVRRGKGWVTLLPLDLIASRSLPARKWRDAAGVVGVASELVEHAQTYRDLVAQLLGGVVVVESYDRALALARSPGRRPRLVTLDGTIIEPGGAVSGGRPFRRSGGFGAPRELAESERAAASAEEDERSALERLDAARRARDAAIHSARLAADALRAAEEGLQRARSTAELHAARRSEAAERVAASEAELDRLPAVAPESEATGVAAGGRGALAEAEAAVVAMRVRLDGARGERDGAARSRLLLESELRNHRDAMERYRERERRRDALMELDAAHATELAEVEADVEAETEAHRAAEAAVPDDLERRRAERDALEAALEAAEVAVREAGASQAATAQELEACRVQLARREAALELALEEMAAFPDGLEALDLSERSARARLRSVTEELEELGAVNHRARQDFDEARTRHDTLAADMHEAEEAVASLEGALQDLDAETSERYERAIAQLQRGFEHHIAELFGKDARGAIDVEFLDGRHHGLRIQLTPPGKRTQALGLLSVGERTMGALAFLFSLMADGDGEGLPIAVLDEVDAPLDEANIRRYCGFLERLATRGTQFVLVTHQKATFEVADVLWGVTTERGVSRVFSIRKEEGAL